MFDPSRDQAREAFFAAWNKYRAGEPLAGIEAVAVAVILLHPEYHELLSQPERYIDRDYGDELNPFLHLSLHLAVEEQLSIDQPPGIASAFSSLISKHHDRHEALHDALECLGETIWKSQREKAPLDAGAYLDCLKKKAR
jgi:hypothetical protein